jgi:hypothetical protein
MTRPISPERAATRLAVGAVFPETATPWNRQNRQNLQGALADLEARCPERVDGDRWRQAVDDGGRFLATWGEQAAALGWGPADLFGLHPTVPLARYDAMGLVWLLRGRRVVALTDTGATIKTETGAVTYRR